MRFLVLFAIAVLIFAVFLFFYQQRMIYLPKPYEDRFRENLPRNVVPLTFTTGQGEQMAFYQDPGPTCSQLWILLGGNAVTALEWLPYIGHYQDPSVGFLLIEYPGYGASAGTPSRDAIMDSCHGALAAWRKHVEGTAAADARLNILGYSLGAATGLNFACAINVDNVILIAPFTSLRDMAKLQVGWPWCWLLRQNFDNRARIAELCARSPRPAIRIIHGTADETIPVEMSRTLAEEFKRMVTYTEIPGESHGVIVEHTGELIREAMSK